MANRLLIDPPNPSNPPVGLIEHVNWVSTNDGHWLNGVRWMEDCSGADAVMMDSCIAVTGSPFSETESRQMRAATPFTVYAKLVCSAVDFYERANELAEQALAREVGWQVEYTFWTGITTSAGGGTTVYPHLAANAQVLDGTDVLQTAATQVVTGSVAPATALGALEAALGDCNGGLGQIHVPQQFVNHLVANGLLIRTGDRLRTTIGNDVIAGNGYRTTGPDGLTPALNTDGWMYATGPVFGYRGPVHVDPRPTTIDRSNDTVTTMAWQHFILGWSCCHLAARVTVS